MILCRTLTWQLATKQESSRSLTLPPPPHPAGWGGENGQKGKLIGGDKDKKNEILLLLITMNMQNKLHTTQIFSSPDD